MKHILKDKSGLYLIEGKGFVGTTKSAATQIDTDDLGCAVKCAARMGVEVTVENAESVAQKSFAVCYVRPGDLDNGAVNANGKNPSRRRFATRDEAKTHADRYNVRKASYGAAAGSAGHVGAYVIETKDPVNSAVNPATGLTNPAPGFPRSYSARMAASGRS